MPKLQSAQRRFQVGDWVRIPLGPRRVDALIVEDRGRIGAGGRRLLAVEVPSDPAEPMRFEVSESEAEPADRQAPEKGKIVRYLKQGGLLAILQSNTSGGRDQPRVWLRYDTLGNVTYTFIERHGQVGGERVPFLAIHGERIFRAKLDAVRHFLMSFGLSRSEADDVIKSVGTAP